MRPAGRVERRRIDGAGAGAGTAPRTRARLGIAAAGLAAVLAVAVFGANSPREVGRPAGIATANQPSPAFSFGPAASAPLGTATPTPAPTKPAPTTQAPTPLPTPRRPRLGSVAVAADLDAVRAVVDRTGWGCAVHVAVGLEPLGSGRIDKLAVTAGEQGMFIDGDRGSGWIGTDPLLAARAFKGRPLLVDAADGLWILRGGAPSVVVRLVPERSRSGALAWRSADVLWQASCAPHILDAKLALRDHASDEWPNGPILDITLVRSPKPAIATRQPQ
jgi:hypothetical protein